MTEDNNRDRISRYADNLATGLKSTGRGLVPILLVVLFASLIRVVLETVGYGLNISEVLNLTSPLSMVVTQSVGLFGALMLVLAYLRVSGEQSLIYRTEFSLSDVGWIVAGLFSLLILNAILSVLTNAFGVTIGENIGVSGESNPIRFLYLVPVMIFLVGPLEEIMFRGVLQGSYREHFSEATSIFLASVIFGVFHVQSIIGTTGGIISYIVIAISLGVVLGYIYEKTRSIIVPAVVHGFYNSVLLIIQYSNTSGLLLF